jgi:hypothetical protein
MESCAESRAPENELANAMDEREGYFFVMHNVSRSARLTSCVSDEVQSAA